MNIEELQLIVNELRSFGETTIIICLGADCVPGNKEIEEQYKIFVERYGFKLTGSLYEIDANQAEKILISIMHRDMAYSYLCIPIEEAAKCACEFLSRFPINARYFTNAHFKQWVEESSGHLLLELKEWNPISQSSCLDTGVIVLSETHQGIFWFEDDD